MYMQILIKLIIGYLALLVVVRIVGKKSLSKMTPFDLIYSMVISGIIEDALYEEKIGLGEILFALFVWTSTIYIFEIIVSKSPQISHLIQGKPSVVIYEGKLVYPALKRNKIEMQQLRQMLRDNECFSLSNAKTLIFENGGSISLIKNDDNNRILSYLLVDYGKVNSDTLKTLNITEESLKAEIAKSDYNLEDIVYGEWSQENGYYFIAESEMIQEQINIE